MPHMANLPWMFVFVMTLPMISFIAQNISSIPALPVNHQKSSLMKTNNSWSW